LITIDFLATVVIVSASGALTPGPLFLASTIRATRVGWVAGLQCAIGHTLIEFPLVIGVSVGLSEFFLGSVKLIGLVGGATLLGFGLLQVINARRPIDLFQKPFVQWDKRSGVVLGLVFTAINPFFLIWWATVGSLLVAQALVLGALLGVLALFGAHIWMDYAWLTGTSTLASRGKLVLGKWYRSLLVFFGLAMSYFGLMFILAFLGWVGQ